MSDPFDDVFTLEDRFYQQGYQQGLEDGKSAGRVEGRQLGMSTGFDKFLEAGRLAGRATVWANRLPMPPPPPSSSLSAKHPGSDACAAASHSSSGSSGSSNGSKTCLLPPLRHNPRLAKNVRMVYMLVEPGTLSTTNDDNDVHDFDDRFRRAQGKARVVEKMIG